MSSHFEQSAFIDSVWPEIKRVVAASSAAINTNLAGNELALKLAADIALLRWEQHRGGDD